MRRRRLPLSREVSGDAFIYRDRGRRVTRRRELKRIAALAIPPAWTNVEIARTASSEVLARGVDAAGRTQTIYHPVYRRKKEREKFERMLRFAAVLPRLRGRMDRDLRRTGLGRDRIAACALRLIDRELFRVGNPQYARAHQSYGVTTLRDEHVTVTGDTLQFAFVAKSGKRVCRDVHDARAARAIARLLALPGPELFTYAEESGAGVGHGAGAGGGGGSAGSELHELRSTHVNAYVRRHAGGEFSAKDFRTWGATVIAAGLMRTASAEEAAADRAQLERAIVAEVAERLGNTPAVARSSYIDPAVLRALDDPERLQRLRARGARLRPRRYQSVEEQWAFLLVTGRRVGR